MNGSATVRSGSVSGASVPSCHSRVPTVSVPSGARSSAPAATSSKASRRTVAWGIPVLRASPASVSRVCPGRNANRTCRSRELTLRPGSLVGGMARLYPLNERH